MVKLYNVLRFKYNAWELIFNLMSFTREHFVQCCAAENYVIRTIFYSFSECLISDNVDIFYPSVCIKIFVEMFFEPRHNRLNFGNDPD